MRGKKIDFDAIRGEHHRSRWTFSGGEHVELRDASKCTTGSFIATVEDPEVTDVQDFIKLDKTMGRSKGLRNTTAS